MHEHLGVRLTSDDPNRAVLFRVESQMVEHQRRMYYFAKRIAKEILAEAKVSADESIDDPELGLEPAT